MASDHLSFFRQRLLEEKAAALSAGEESEAKVHLKLAERYAALVDIYAAAANAEGT